MSKGDKLKLSESVYSLSKSAKGSISPSTIEHHYHINKAITQNQFYSYEIYNQQNQGNFPP